MINYFYKDRVNVRRMVSFWQRMGTAQGRELREVACFGRVQSNRMTTDEIMFQVNETGTVRPVTCRVSASDLINVYAYGTGKQQWVAAWRNNSLEDTGRLFSEDNQLAGGFLYLLQ